MLIFDKDSEGMKSVLHIPNINDYNEMVNHETLHPLVSMIDFSKFHRTRNAAAAALSFGFYSVFFKEDKHCEIKYGRKHYDYQAGTLVFIGPDQVVGIEEDGSDYQPSGYALLFHPDLIRGTILAPHMKDYPFFSYDVHEALHLSAQEKEIALDCCRKVAYELQHAMDKHSKRLIAVHIDVLLSYCVRFYDRQFISRNLENSGLIAKFDTLLTDYFETGKAEKLGIASVAYFADVLHLSANYFGDLIKRETGKTAQEYIQGKLLQAAKQKMFNANKSISQIAYELGFSYPQHFSRFFKQHSGHSPNEYRLMN